MHSIHVAATWQGKQAPTHEKSNTQHLILSEAKPVYFMWCLTKSISHCGGDDDDDDDDDDEDDDDDDDVDDDDDNTYLC